MKLETFYAEYFKRLGITRKKQDVNKLADAEQCAQAINAMTGGALFKGVEKIAEDWQWPAMADYEHGESCSE